MKIRYCSNSSNYFIYSLIAVVILIMLYAAYRSNVIIVKISNPDAIILPEQLKHRLITDKESELLYIDYHHKSLQYYFISHNEVRVKTILDSLRKIIISLRYKIPEGRYLLSLHDAAPHSYAIPILAFASDAKYLEKQDVVLMPDPFVLQGYNKIFWNMSAYKLKYPWHKKFSKIFFRGSATGVGSENNDINGFPRVRFMHYAEDLPIADVGFTAYTGQLNLNFRNKLAGLYPLRDKVSPAKAQAYKYLIDIDGNTCGYSRMAWILYSNSVLLKHQSSQVQWYYGKLKPYVHYLPINEDFSNLETQYAFLEANPLLAKQIANNSYKLALKVFSPSQIQASLAEAFTKYQELLAYH